MPAKSAKQKRFMQAVANNPKFANKVDVPQSVGAEYTKENKMKKKMNMGGPVADAAGARAMDPRMAMAMEAQRRQAAAGGMKKGGKVKRNTSKMNSLEELGRVDAEKAYTKKGKRNLKSEKKRVVSEVKRGYKKGGMIDKEGRALALARTGGSNAPMNAKGKMADARGRAMKAGGKVSGKSSSSASKRADGIAQRGRTRGQMR